MSHYGFNPLITTDNSCRYLVESTRITIFCGLVGLSDGILIGMHRYRLACRADPRHCSAASFKLIKSLIVSLGLSTLFDCTYKVLEYVTN